MQIKFLEKYRADNFGFWAKYDAAIFGGFCSLCHPKANLNEGMIVRPKMMSSFNAIHEGEVVMVKMATETFSTLKVQLARIQMIQDQQDKARQFKLNKIKYRRLS